MLPTQNCIVRIGRSVLRFTSMKMPPLSLLQRATKLLSLVASSHVYPTCLSAEDICGYTIVGCFFTV